MHELFEEGDTAYLVMELLEGASLSSLLKRNKRLSLGEKLSIIDQIAAGLSEAHAHQIIHRDLKPSNVFVLKSGVVKVLDFGVAKVIEVIAEGKSVEDALENAVKEASKSIHGIKSVYAEGIQALVDDGKIDKYRVNAKVTFVVD